ncbi:hypothetical protein CAPTEDRAFT_202797 [Capitella teleta]|uniref:SHSP domain-containing protein n=1 Tax=Capitella teleta TaxID=283909 RepID=R7USR4_CAPTE|nr:hypothetical protein CAPTEDRAFT_202797 [Capitella teleta]|eukprot:ELU09183.1 hypothetical protein CAPTEDRAFT_202797 [Capitella teleta]
MQQSSTLLASQAVFFYYILRFKRNSIQIIIIERKSSTKLRICLAVIHIPHLRLYTRKLQLVVPQVEVFAVLRRCAHAIDEVKMLDPEALAVFRNDLQRPDSIPSGSDEQESGDEVQEIQIEKLSVRDKKGSESEEEVEVTSKGSHASSRTSSRNLPPQRDTGVFRNAVSPPFATLPYTKSIPVEEGDAEFDDDENEEEYEEEVARGHRSSRNGSDVRVRDSSPRRQRSHPREIIPDPKQEDDFVFNGQRLRIGPKQKPAKVQGGKRFLRKVQHELEEQRQEWKSEVERMLQGSQKLQTLPKNSQTGGSNTFVDTSGVEPIFTAFFDMSEFPPNRISVTIDKLQNKVVVQAMQASRAGNMSKSFTQKVQLPRFSDEHRLTSKLSKKGILKVEVPLMYYFANDADKSKKAKSFVNEVKTNPKTGKQSLEILVNTDPDIRSKDLHVQVDDGKLVISADVISSRSGKSKRKLIKQYTLPALANPDKIRSRLGKDGRLAITVPLRRVDTSVRDSAGSPGVKTLKHEVTKQYNGGTLPLDYSPRVQQVRYQTLESRPSRSVHHQMRTSTTRSTPSHHKSEPILYEPEPRTRMQPSQTTERVKVVRTRKVRR